MKSLHVVVIFVAISFACLLAHNYMIRGIKTELKSHDHNEAYLSKSPNEPDVDSVVDLLDRTDSKIQTQIKFLKNFLEFELGNNHTMPTNGVLDRFFKYYGYKLQYISPQVTDPEIKFEQEQKAKEAKKQ